MQNPAPKFEDYEIEETVGTGHGGTLFRGFRAAENAGLGRRDLVYRAFGEISGDVNAVDRVRERLARSVGMTHANLLAPIRASFAQEELTLVSEWLPGASLAAVDARDGVGRWPLPAAVHLALEVAKALHHVSSTKGLAHGLVRPESVFLGFDGQVKLLSLGMAAAEQTALEARQGHAEGLANFASPEQAAGRELDGRSDFFSLGALLWGLVAGRPLFPSGKREEWLRVLSEKDPPPPSQANPEVPAELDSIVTRLLERDMYLRCDGERAVKELSAVLSYRFPDFTSDEFVSLCRARTVPFQDRYQSFLSSRERPSEETKSIEAPTPAPTPTPAPRAEAAPKITVERAAIQLTPVEGPRPSVIREPGGLTDLLDSRIVMAAIVACAFALLALPVAGPRFLSRVRAHRAIELKARAAANGPKATLHLISNEPGYDLLVDGKPAKIWEDTAVVPANRELLITAQKEGFEEIETVTALMANEDLDLKLEFKRILSSSPLEEGDAIRAQASKPGN